MDLGIAGKRAAVAAASQGLGKATAMALAAEGVTVAICSRSRERIEAAAADIPGAIPLVADVGSEEGAAVFVRDASAALGGIDILVANAGGPPRGTFATTDIESYREAFEANCMSTIVMCREAVPDMRARQWGRVLAITSVSVRQPNPTVILSNSARAGLTGFLKTLATEIASDGVTVNSIQPGNHDTARIRELGAAGVAVEGPLGSPGDFGQVAAFLCSEPARFVNGAAVHVDGGAYAGLQ